MEVIRMRKSLLTLIFFSTLILSGCGYNTLQSTDEQIKASWAEVLNQYKRRADLVPNLVNVVKGFAAQEKEVLLGVTNARSKVGSIQVTPELINDPQAFTKFQNAQGELSSALSRLLVVAENYPELKSDANFRDLQAQLEGTENRITLARNRYIKAGRNTISWCVLFPAISQPWYSVFRQNPVSLLTMSRKFPRHPRLTLTSKTPPGKHHALHAHA